MFQERCDIIWYESSIGLKLMDQTGARMYVLRVSSCHHRIHLFVFLVIANRNVLPFPLEYGFRLVFEIFYLVILLKDV